MVLNYKIMSPRGSNSDVGALWCSRVGRLRKTVVFQWNNCSQSTLKRFLRKKNADTTRY